MTTTTKTKKMPAPLYAVAGVGELAYRRLRRLPDDLERLPVLAAALRSEIPAAVGTVVARAQGVYHELVTRGEAAVASTRSRTTGGAGDATPAPARPHHGPANPAAARPAPTRAARHPRRATQ